MFAPNPRRHNWSRPVSTTDWLPDRSLSALDDTANLRASPDIAWTPKPQRSLLQRVNSSNSIEMKSLSIEDTGLPDALATLLTNVYDAIEGSQGLIDPSQYDLLGAHFSSARSAKHWERDMLYSTARAELGPPLAPDFVDDVLALAKECDECHCPESSWCEMVYYPLLCNAFQGAQNGDSDCLLRVLPCSTACITPRYLPFEASSIMVDYTIAVQPTTDSMRAKVDAWCSETDEQSINHTDYTSLLKKPIALSIAVQRTSDAVDTAKLQLCVWLAAHWRKLDELNANTGTEESTLPDFLLGIIIQGHDWSLVASTRDKEKAIIWTKLTFGTTGNPMGIFKIDWTLRYLAQYIRDDYWETLKLIMEE